MKGKLVYTNSCDETLAEAAFRRWLHEMLATRDTTPQKERKEA
jgi:hypothetical protein